MSVVAYQTAELDDRRSRARTAKRVSRSRPGPHLVFATDATSIDGERASVPLTA
jgi:hypothetical protein